MRIDAFSDAVCPWCYIGKRHLQSALRQAGITDADIHWRAFQLNPDLPPEGRERREYLREKFGDDFSAERLHGRVAEAGRAVGLDFQFDKITRSPNTFNVHRLIRQAQAAGLGDVMVESLFNAYFMLGRDLGDAATLAELGRAAGLRGDLQEFLAGDAQADAVQSDLDTAREIGISGVPFFILANRYSLSGAQPVSLFVQALKAAGEKARAIH